MLEAVEWKLLRHTVEPSPSPGPEHELEVHVKDGPAVTGDKGAEALHIALSGDAMALAFVVVCTSSLIPTL